MANRGLGVCPVCERRVRARKDESGRRVMHYVNITKLLNHELKPCAGATSNGVRPSADVIADGKKTGIRCPACDKRVKETRDFRPAKHFTPGTTKECSGETDNKRTR